MSDNIDFTTHFWLRGALWGIKWGISKRDNKTDNLLLQSVKKVFGLSFIKVYNIDIENSNIEMKVAYVSVIMAKVRRNQIK